MCLYIAILVSITEGGGRDKKLRLDCVRDRAVEDTIFARISHIGYRIGNSRVLPIIIAYRIGYLESSPIRYSRIFADKIIIDSLFQMTHVSNISTAC
jgi:hypothetical protein